MSSDINYPFASAGNGDTPGRAATLWADASSRKARKRLAAYRLLYQRPGPWRSGRPFVDALTLSTTSTVVTSKVTIAAGPAGACLHSTVSLHAGDTMQYAPRRCGVLVHTRSPAIPYVGGAPARRWWPDRYAEVASAAGRGGTSQAHPPPLETRLTRLYPHGPSA